MGLTPVLFNLIPKGLVYLSERNSVSTQTIKIKDTRKKLEDALSEIKGQEIPKKQILDAISGWFEAKENKIIKLAGLVIHLAGASGAGKTMATEVISTI